MGLSPWAKENLKSFLFCRLGFRFHLASSLLLVLHAFPFQYFSIPFFILCFCLGLFAFVLSYAFLSVVDSEGSVFPLCFYGPSTMPMGLI